MRFLVVFLFLLSGLPFGGNAQNSADKHFYLIDDLNLSDLSKHDRTIIDSCLSVYHTAQNHESKISSLTYICDNISNSCWTKYQVFQYNFIKRVMAEAMPEDEHRKIKEHLVNALTNLGVMAITNGNKHQALDYYTEGLEISKRIDHKIGIARSLIGLGLSHKDLEKPEQALQYLNQAYAEYQYLNDSLGQADVLFNIGETYRWLGKHTQAINYLKKSLSIYDEIDRLNGVLVAQNSIALIETNRGNIKKAIDLFNQNLEISERLGYDQSSAGTNNNIGDLYLTLGENETAIQYFEHALAIAEKIGSPKLEALYLNNIGRALAQNKNYEKAISYYKQSYETEKSINNEQGIARALNNLSKAYFYEQDTLKAIEYCDQSIAIYKRIQYKVGEATSEINLAEFLFSTGDSSRAYIHAKRGFDLCQEMGSTNELKTASNVLYQIYKSMGDFERALHMHELYIASRDSIVNLENRTLLIRTQAELENQKNKAKFEQNAIAKNLKLKDQEHKIKDQKYISVLLLLLLVVVILFVMWRKSRYTLSIKQLQEQVVKSQMKPHFIFNVLVSIQSLILQKREQDAVYYLSEVATFMRTNLNMINERQIPISQELDIIENYLKLEKLRFKDKLNYDIIQPENTGITYKVPPLIIQPIVENSIVHGFAKTIDGGHVKIWCEDNGSHLSIFVEDNGYGLSEQPELNSKGLSIVRKRLKLANKKNKIEISNRKNSSGVAVRIDIY